MTIHKKTKGANGEREVAALLNGVLLEVASDLKIGLTERDMVQRNQNQSAVGGEDLTNTFSFAIEVKRQEALAVNTWWQQACASARQGQIPVLMYRQNHKDWHVMLETNVMGVPMRITIRMNDFLRLFRCEAMQRMSST